MNESNFLYNVGNDSACSVSYVVYIEIWKQCCKYHQENKFCTVTALPDISVWDLKKKHKAIWKYFVYVNMQNILMSANSCMVYALIFEQNILVAAVIFFHLYLPFPLFVSTHSPIHYLLLKHT